MKPIAPFRCFSSRRLNWPAQRLSHQAILLRPFTSSSQWKTEDNPIQPPTSPPSQTSQSPPTTSASSVDLLKHIIPPSENPTQSLADAIKPSSPIPHIDELVDRLSELPPHNDPNDIAYQTSTTLEPHHLHIFSHKHNTHVTLTRPECTPLISVSAGNIGFKHTMRGSFDAAYQLTAWVLKRITDQGLLAQIEHLELVFRGFGKGREAATKAILGIEGRQLRKRIVKVTDGTRIKIGGTRAQKPKRR